VSLYIGDMSISIIAALVIGQAGAYKFVAEGVPGIPSKRVEKAVAAGFSRVEKYFGKKFASRFDVVVAATRARFDAETQSRWKMPASEKWMVGAGAANVLLILSPDRWKTEAVEHDGDSERELNEIAAHELVHVYHAQVCPNHDFEGMDEMGWFAEGLAVRVSGQLESVHKEVAKRAVNEGKVPNLLSEAWSGKYRYGVAGSMVKFVEAKWGKGKVLDLLKATSNPEALKMLNLSDGDFIHAWRQWVEAS
jgi:hypothetical protein